MDKKEIVVLVLSSAAIGALVSGALTALAQWRERVARKRELLLKVSVELSKAYIDRISSLSKKFVSVPEFSVLPLMHSLVRELFEGGVVSPDKEDRLKDFALAISRASDHRATSPGESNSQSAGR
jgi:hypothetical protein